MVISWELKYHNFVENLIKKCYSHNTKGMIYYGTPVGS